MRNWTNSFLKFVMRNGPDKGARMRAYGMLINRGRLRKRGR